MEYIRLATVIVLGMVANANGLTVEDIHLLTISNGHYLSTGEDSGNTDYSGAHVSSATVAKVLGERFPLKSFTALRSDRNRIISRSDVFAALERVRQRIGKPTGSDYLFVYYVGHGYGEGFGWNYFLQPGNVYMPEQLNVFNVEAIAEQLVYVSDLVDELNKFGLPYALFIDACYEGDPRDIRTPVLSETALQNIKDIAAIILHMNQFHQTNPVVFAATPGKTVTTVEHPTHPDLGYRIGPIARRMVLYFDKGMPTRAYTVRDIVEGLKQKDLDDGTEPVISFHEMQSAYVLRSNLAQDQGLKAALKEEFYGTSSRGDVTVLAGRLGDANTGDLYDGEDAVPDEHPYAVKFATLTITSEKGEYILDGKDRVFTSSTAQFILSILTANEIVLEINVGDEYWNFAIALPAGEAFSAKTYRNVVRYPFQEPPAAGMDVSGDGRGCNDIDGEWTITSIAYNGDRPSTISMTFFQRCDESKLQLTGRLVAEFEVR